MHGGVGKIVAGTPLDPALNQENVAAVEVGAQNLAKQIENEVRTYFGDSVFPKSVPLSVKFREAYARGIPLVIYDRAGQGAIAYQDAARILAERWGLEPLKVSGKSSQKKAG